MNHIVRALLFLLFLIGSLLCRGDQITRQVGKISYDSLAQEGTVPQLKNRVRTGLAQKRMSRLAWSDSDDRRP